MDLTISWKPHLTSDQDGRESCTFSLVVSAVSLLYGQKRPCRFVLAIHDRRQFTLLLAISLMVTVSLAASLIPISVVALILSGYSFFVRSSLLDSKCILHANCGLKLSLILIAGFKFELVQSLLMVCNSLGFLNAVGIVVRVALDLCRANNEEENPSSVSKNN